VAALKNITTMSTIMMLAKPATSILQMSFGRFVPAEFIFYRLDIGIEWMVPWPFARAAVTPIARLCVSCL
jgi:hypothetical protein